MRLATACSEQKAPTTTTLVGLEAVQLALPREAPHASADNVNFASQARP